jgi:hypothetical protein
MNAENTDMKQETAKNPYPVEAQHVISFSNYNDLRLSA